MRKNLKLVLSLLLLLVATMFVFSCEDESDDTPLDYNMADPDSNGWNDVTNSRSPYYQIDRWNTIVYHIDSSSGSATENGEDAERIFAEYDDKGRITRKGLYLNNGSSFYLDEQAEYTFGNESSGEGTSTSKITEGTSTDAIATGEQKYEIKDDVWYLTEDKETRGSLEITTTYTYNSKGRVLREVRLENGSEVSKIVSEYDEGNNLLQSKTEYSGSNITCTTTNTITNGQIVTSKIDYTDNTEKSDEETTYTYDSSGFVYKKDIKYTDGDYDGETYTFEYILGRQGVPESYTFTGTTSGSGSYKYDSKLRTTEDNMKNAAGKNLSMTYYTFDKFDFTLGK